MTTPNPCTIRTKQGKRITGYIFSSKDSILTIGRSSLKNQDAAIKILRDRNIPRKEREKKYIELMYCDTIQIAFSSLKKIRSWEKPFTSKYFIGLAASIAFAEGTSQLTRQFIPSADDPQYFRFVTALLVLDLGIIITADYFLLFTKRIGPKKWILK